jgi:hypothetical protein
MSEEEAPRLALGVKPTKGYAQARENPKEVLHEKSIGPASPNILVPLFSLTATWRIVLRGRPATRSTITHERGTSQIGFASPKQHLARRPKGEIGFIWQKPA